MEYAKHYAKTEPGNFVPSKVRPLTLVLMFQLCPPTPKFLLGDHRRRRRRRRRGRRKPPPPPRLNDIWKPGPELQSM